MLTNINEMKDWGLSFQNKKSAKIFYKILKEGVSIHSNEESEPNEEFLGKRDSLWSDEEEPRESEDGKPPFPDRECVFLGLNKTFV